MTRLVRRTPQARQDLLELASYIARDSLARAMRFLDAVEMDLKKLAQMPGLGAHREFSDPRLADIRSWPVHGHPNHLLFYRPISNGIELVRCLHGARDLDAALGEPET